MYGERESKLFIRIICTYIQPVSCTLNVFCFFTLKPQEHANRTSHREAAKSMLWHAQHKKQRMRTTNSYEHLFCIYCYFIISGCRNPVDALAKQCQ